MINYSEEEIAVFDMGDEPVRLSLDKGLFPKESHSLLQSFKDSVKELNEDPEKFFGNIWAVKKQVWHLAELVRERLSTIPEKDEDYNRIEEHYKTLRQADAVLLQFVRVNNKDQLISMYERQITNPFICLN